MIYVSTLFDGKDGLYYDPVGDELFVAKRIGITLSVELGCRVPVYQLDFGDESLTGAVKDHGFHLYLGEV